MRYLIGFVISLFCFVPAVSAENGLVNVKSAHGVKATADRLGAGTRKRG